MALVIDQPPFFCKLPFFILSMIMGKRMQAK